MAAATAKKTTPRRAPAKSRPATTEEKITAFDELRARAGGRRAAAITAPPYVLGKDMGFDPPIEIAFPEGIGNRVALELAARRGDVTGFLTALIPDDNLVRILAALQRQPDGDRLLIGLQLKLVDHFFGPGAGDVPGGTPAS
ncbi:hypothetical protein [Nocardia farcinica]|uniref:hypothetical protein n=1 Tax=Nocardia farcinica TaxID=37329 RepID=UPI00379D3719